MLSLSWVRKQYNDISYFFIRPPPLFMCRNYKSYCTLKEVPVMDNYFNLFREMISLRGLSDHTLSSYCTYIRSYLDYLERILKKNPEDVSWAELRDFIRWLQCERGLSDRSVNAVIAQLRFFTIYVLHKPWVDSQLPTRRFDSYLPFVPSQEDTWIFISSIQDLRFKAIVSLMYFAGLRSGEVRHLKYSDISRKDMRIHILHSKSKNDRYAPLSSNALSILTEYWFAYNKPTEWLFPSDWPGKNGKAVPVSSQYMSSHIRGHEAALGWEHRITAHTFRHAFATHLYENGSDLLTIKALLGAQIHYLHNHLRTSCQYYFKT